MFNDVCCVSGRDNSGSNIKKTQRLKVVLDIDETLIHAEVNENVAKLRTGMDGSNESKRSDKVEGILVKIQALDGTLHDVVVRKRPGVDRFLRNLALEHDVYAFTASFQVVDLEDYWKIPGISQVVNWYA